MILTFLKAGNPRQVGAKPVVRVLTCAEFARERLGFEADEKQPDGVGFDVEDGHSQLFAAVGEIDGEGGSPGVD